jgi:hypothetical protein
MNYTIAATEEVHTGFKAQFDKSGNEYIVWVSLHGATHKKRYDNRDDAVDAYLRITKAIVTSRYDWDGRKALL